MEDKHLFNELLARDEKELILFEQYDINMDEIKRKKHIENYKNNNNNNNNIPPMPTPLMTADEVPSWVMETNYDNNNNHNMNTSDHKNTNYFDNKLGFVDTSNYGRGNRQRKVMSYADNISDEMFKTMLESGATVGMYVYRCKV